MQTEIRRRIDVRFGSKADICDAKSHVRFTLESGHMQCTRRCPLSANSGHEALSPLGLNEFAGVGHAELPLGFLWNRRDHLCSEYKF